MLMSETQQIHHRRIVYILFAILMVLSALLVLTLFRAGFLEGIIDTKENGNLATSAFSGESEKTFLHEEESVIVKSKTHDGQVLVLPIQKVLFEYIEIIDSCGPYFEGGCVNVRSGPGTDYPAVAKLRSNMVLKISGKVERDGYTWYKVVFDEWLRFPERVKSDWYVSADYVKVLLDEGIRMTGDENDVVGSSTKHIIVNRATQTLSAYEGEELFMTLKVSTGLELTPTPVGTFTIFKKMPSRYMQGPIEGVSDQYYDLPGVPWNLYFTQGGAAIHGAYWHVNFGRKFSHGCVNLPPDKARELYDWAELGTLVIVKN